ncbi:MAG: phosphoribosylanthranilate isomerase [Gemmiger sp.]|nr:phosphoribosylanthranilate isomerase [Gemmiger sp.]
MSGCKIKICGLRRMADITAANALTPELIGFVFAENSPRYVSPAAAAALKAALAPQIQAVGVFVNAPVAQVAALLQSGVIDCAQLHGNENDAYLTALRRLTGQPCIIIQAFQVKTAADVARAKASQADCILLDHGPGGTGQPFDWSLLQNVGRRFILAGGLNAENVTAALRLAHPDIVDVSSGVETGGVKDPAKMRAFVRAVRAYPNEAAPPRGSI